MWDEAIENRVVGAQLRVGRLRSRVEKLLREKRAMLAFLEDAGAHVGVEPSDYLKGGINSLRQTIRELEVILESKPPEVAVGNNAV